MVTNNPKERLIRSTNGKFQVQFIKKNGESRTMNARLGVSINLKGGKNKVQAKDRPYLTVYDLDKKEYRTVNLDSTYMIKIKGKTYEFRY
jgi:hypothetical protein